MYSDDNGCIQLKVGLRTLIYTSFTFPNCQQLHLLSVNSVALFYFIFQTKNSLVRTAVMMKVSVTKMEFQFYICRTMAILIWHVQGLSKNTKLFRETGSQEGLACWCFIILAPGVAHSAKGLSKKMLGRFSLKNTDYSVVYAILITITALRHLHQMHLILISLLNSDAQITAMFAT